jgi:hypothetical protein
MPHRSKVMTEGYPDPPGWGLGVVFLTHPINNTVTKPTRPPRMVKGHVRLRARHNTWTKGLVIRTWNVGSTLQGRWKTFRMKFESFSMI